MNERKEHKKNHNEPDNFINRKLRLFTSLTEMNEADAREMASLSPKEHLQNANFLIEKIFEEELKKPMDKKIKFKVNQ